MIINHSHRFIFVHVPKAAGTSVTTTLSKLTRYCDQEIGGTAFGEAVQPFFIQRFGLRKHSPSREIIEVVGEETWQNYFTFSFVRNPFDRLVSSYFFLKSWPGVPEAFAKDFAKFENLDAFLTSDLWVERSGPDNIFLPQVSWIMDAKDRNILIDFFGKTENMTKDLKIIEKNIGAEISSSKPVVANKTTTYEKKTDWNDDLISRITQRYEKDFCLLDYATSPGISLDNTD